MIRAVYADVTEAVTPTGFGFGVGDWIQPNFSGSVQSGSGGTLIDFKSNLALPNQSMLVPHFWYRWAHGQIFDVRYQQYSQIVSTTLNAPETFQGITIPAGGTANTTIKLQWADVSYELPIAYDVFPPKDSYLNALIDVRAIRGTFILNGGTHRPITVPFPMFGIHGKAKILNDTDVEYKIAGITAGFEDAIGTAYDAEAGVVQTLYQGISVTGKYRYSHFYNRDANNNSFWFRYYGPEVDLNFQF